MFPGRMFFLLEYADPPRVREFDPRVVVLCSKEDYKMHSCYVKKRKGACSLLFDGMACVVLVAIDRSTKR